MATQAYCAKLMGISERRFRELRDEGVLPDAEKGEYDIEIVLPIYCEHLRTVAAGRGGGEGQVVKSNADARLVSARAEKAEMEAAEMRGSLVPVDQIAGAVHSAVIIMKTRLGAVPAKTAPLVAGVKSIPAVERVIRDNIEEALGELAKVEVLKADAG
jgi:phage terminase Nu1 subunit (DNA packaging protein)